VVGRAPPGGYIPWPSAPAIGPPTDYILDAALPRVRQWRQVGHELARAVNVSAVACTDPAVVQQWIAEVSATRAAAEAQLRKHAPPQTPHP
jgi:hypothetical protein